MKYFRDKINNLFLKKLKIGWTSLISIGYVATQDPPPLQLEKIKRAREWSTEGSEEVMHSGPNYSNGYHRQQQQEGSEMRLGMSHRERGRRGARRSRDSRDGTGRVSEQQQQQQQQRHPCTDFDMAYFHSYAHVGIHEEMIKVFSFSESFLFLVFF